LALEPGLGRTEWDRHRAPMGPHRTQAHSTDKLLIMKNKKLKIFCNKNNDENCS
jgi:hypothetical protein